MNAPIQRLFALVVLLFGVLVFFTSKWTVFDAQRLRDNDKNQRPLLQSQRIERGTIRAADGTVIARSVRGRDDVFSRRYPTDSLFSHAIGYSFTLLGQAGLERERNDELTGANNELGSIVDELRGKQRAGDDVKTTLDPDAQRVALDALRSAEGGRGSVVAIDPRTGAVKVMASTPDYDPNELRRDDNALARLNKDDGSPLFNRATQAGYPPGSTFKVLTAVAGIDTGKYTPESVLDGSNGIRISGVPLQNDGGEDFGRISLTDALTNSVNTVFGQIAEDVGKRTMARYMDRFGFNRRPELDYPRDTMQASGEYTGGCGGRLLRPTSDKVDVGRMGIGQDKLCVTPLQMALVASAVANGGVLMRPHLTDEVVDQDGRVKDRFGGEEQARVMKAQTAADVTAMMQRVVDEGTGTAAALSGLSGQVAGKTGTAEIDVQRDIAQPWFIGFAPANNPRIAIAVTVERSQGGFGGTVAAPIFKRVAEELLK